MLWRKPNAGPGRVRWNQLERYGRDLTRALPGKPEPLVERKETDRLLAGALLRETGGNAALLGPPGSGRRSAVRALARAMARGEAPTGLESRQVFWIDAANLVAGSRYRGELEERVSRLGDEVAAGRGRLVVVLEDAALLAGGDAGASSGGVALSRLLRPGGWILPLTPAQRETLARVVPDWETLIQTVEIPGWDDAACEEVISVRLPALEEHHGLRFSPGSPRTAIRLARRYLRRRALPGAALELLDHAAALARANGEAEVGRSLLLESVATRTGLPLKGLDATLPGAGSEERWLGAEEALTRRVVGQEKAVRAVAAALRRARTGLGDPRRPLGSFLFVGPTGVGKTELGRALAEFLFGSEGALVRVDMSEYMERHAVARLIGAPPGYVGFELPGQLTDPVMRRPFSVVLMDEAEKAHPDVLNLLLQILEDGRLTDGYGRTVDFRHTVVVLTSNAGSQEARGAGERAPEVFMEHVRRLFRPELLNRLDDVVLFSPLSVENMEKIAVLQLGRACERLDAWSVSVDLTPAARRALARAGHDPEYGARPLRRLIDREILDLLARALLAGELAAGDRVVFDGAPGKWSWRKDGTGGTHEAALP